MCWFQKLFICCCKVVFPKINWTLLEDFLEILFLSLIFWCRGPRWLHTSVPICAHFVHFPTFDASPVPAGNYSLYCHEICIIVFMCECFNVQKLIMQQIPAPFFFFFTFSIHHFTFKFSPYFLSTIASDLHVNSMECINYTVSSHSNNGHHD